jgi:hypothetical protein
MGVNGRACTSPRIAARSGCGASRAVSPSPIRTSVLIAFSTVGTNARKPYRKDYHSVTPDRSKTLDLCDNEI